MSIVNMHQDRKQLILQSAAALLVRVAGAGLQFMFNVLLGRIAGADGVGLYYLSFTIVSFGLVFSRMGIDTALVRYVAASKSGQEEGKLNAYVLEGMKSVAIAALVVQVLLLCSAGFIATHIFGDARLQSGIIAMSFSVWPFSMLMVLSESLRGLGKTTWSQTLQAVLPQLVLVGGIIIFSALQVKDAAQKSFVIGCVIALLFAWACWKKNKPQSSSRKDDNLRNELLRTALPLMWVSSLHFVNGWMATFVIGVITTPGEAGLFNAAQRTAQLTTLILIAVNAVSAPKFSALYHQEKISELSVYGKLTTKMICALSIPLIILGAVFSESVMKLFGDEFAAGSDLLKIMLISSLINVGTGSVGQILAMTGHEKDLRNVILLSACINTVLCFLFGYFWEAMGVAYGLGVGGVVASIYASVLLKMRLGIKIHLLAS